MATALVETEEAAPSFEGPPYDNIVWLAKNQEAELAQRSLAILVLLGQFQFREAAMSI